MLEMHEATGMIDEDGTPTILYTFSPTFAGETAVDPANVLIHTDEISGKEFLAFDGVELVRNLGRRMGTIAFTPGSCELASGAQGRVAGGCGRIFGRETRVASTFRVIESIITTTQENLQVSEADVAESLVPEEEFLLSRSKVLVGFI